MKLPFIGTGFNPKKFATKEGNTWRLVPAQFYPAMIAYIREAIKAEDLPEELIDRHPTPGIEPKMAARRYKTAAQRITEQAWADALQATTAIPTGERLLARAQALECARLWFTRALKNIERPPIRIRIERDDDYRLGV